MMGENIAGLVSWMDELKLKFQLIQDTSRQQLG
jgi:hypothetical protein